MTLPNFLIIGQMKAGTSSLHAYLRQHPQIFMPTIKETRFFCERIDDPTRSSWVKKGLPVTFAEYESLFEPATDHVAIGEASPQYLQRQHAPGQIKQYLPEARLIVSLRRPSDRLYSSHLMAVRGGREQRDFATAFREGKDERRVAENFTHAALKRYYDLFDRARIKPLKFDNLVSRVQATLEEIFVFLDVDETFQPNASTAHNEGGVWKNPALGRITTGIGSNMPLMRNLKRVMPAGLWKLAKKAHAGNVAKAPPLSAEMRHEVSSYFREDTLRVQDLVGLDLSDWLAE